MISPFLRGVKSTFVLIEYDYCLEFIGLRSSGQITTSVKEILFTVDLLINSNISNVTLLRFENNSRFS
ncbi:uncharacterized protein LOC108743593 isoform X2 [Agrilus planipennis]|uniref:Uncharacterized protein LOC108743593 isoform X2 n=1 Tax=Agrilus planipennis TaxID=224129 RepID=A0A1W4XQI8_AGRPL|nr:uncharacterized protein LOC108743593 isoform X2 [Agrilus planipennis]